MKKSLFIILVSWISLRCYFCFSAESVERVEIQCAKEISTLCQSEISQTQTSKLNSNIYETPEIKNIYISIWSCLEKHKEKISARCKSYKDLAARLRVSCSKDIAKYCKNVRMMACLRQNITQLDSSCRDLIPPILQH